MGHYERRRRRYYDDDYDYEPRRRRRGFSCLRLIPTIVGTVLLAALLLFAYIALRPYFPIIGIALLVVLIIAALFGFIWLCLYFYGMLQEQLYKRDRRDVVRVQKGEQIVVRQRTTRDLRYLQPEEPALVIAPQQQLYLPHFIETPTDPILEAVRPVERDPIIYYANVRGSIHPGQVLLGVREDATLRIGQWNDFKTLLVLGSMASGKSNTMAEKTAQAAQNGALIVPCDPHARKPDSLYRRVAPLSRSLYPGATFAVTHEEILYNVRLVRDELENRINGGQYSRPVLLILDEWNRLQRDEEMAEELIIIAETIGQEGRDFGIYLMVGAQIVSYHTRLRKSLIARIVHRIDESEAKLVIPARFAKYAPELTNGMAFVKDADGVTERLQQTFISSRDIEMIASGYFDPSLRAAPGLASPHSPKRTQHITRDLEESTPPFHRNNQPVINNVSPFQNVSHAQKQRFETPKHFVETQATHLPNYPETLRIASPNQQTSKQVAYENLRVRVIQLAQSGMSRRSIAKHVGLQGEKYKIISRILDEAGL